MDDIVDQAAALSGAERDAIADDVARFVETLVARGLVVPTPRPSRTSDRGAAYAWPVRNRAAARCGRPRLAPITTSADSEHRDHDRVQPLVLDAFGVRVAVLPPDEPTRGRWARAVVPHPHRARLRHRRGRRRRPVDRTGRRCDRTDYTLASRVTLAALEQRGACG